MAAFCAAVSEFTYAVEPRSPSSSAPHQPNRRCRVGWKPVRATGERHLEVGGRAGAVVVDARAGGDAVQVRADHQGVGGVAARPVRDQVVAGRAVVGERLLRWW